MSLVYCSFMKGSGASLSSVSTPCTDTHIYNSLHLNSFSVTETVEALRCFDIDYLTMTQPSPFCFFPAAFLTQTVCLDDTTVKFEIWDTAGQERYHSLAPMYYRGAQAAIVVYDITNEVPWPAPPRLKWCIFIASQHRPRRFSRRRSRLHVQRTG